LSVSESVEIMFSFVYCQRKYKYHMGRIGVVCRVCFKQEPFFLYTILTMFRFHVLFSVSDGWI